MGAPNSHGKESLSFPALEVMRVPIAACTTAVLLYQITCMLRRLQYVPVFMFAPLLSSSPVLLVLLSGGISDPGSRSRLFSPLPPTVGA